MSNQIKIERLQSLVLRDLTLILQRELNEPALADISIHEVKLTSDLSHAKVYYSSIVNSDDKETAQQNLDSWKGEIRHKLSQKLETYKCPELNFIYDESLDNAKRIEELLSK